MININDEVIEQFSRFKRIHGLDENVTNDEIYKLSSGMPFQKIIGFIEFDDVKVNVNRNVLIPRYETEEVMRFALSFINEKSRVLDLCCGSGYIGLSIKKKVNCSVVMSDISDEAILQSSENSEMNNLEVDILKSDLFENINERFDLIISNPPYIPENTKLSNSVLNFEPSNALFAGKDGNDLYRKIVEQAPQYLTSNGTLVFEISDDNVDFLTSEGFEILNDINDKPRIAWRKYNES